MNNQKNRDARWAGRAGLALSLMLLVVLLAACGGSGQAVEPTAVPTPIDTVTAVPTDTPTPAPTKTPTATPAPTDTPTATLAPTDTPTPTPEPATGRPPASPDIVYIGNPTTPDGDPQVNISFDVQGDPATLYQILDILDQYGVRTTFFLQGEWVEQYPEAAQEIVRRGHEVGNHSWTHQDFKPLTADVVTQELEDTEALVKEVTGQTTKPYFRPPYGSRSDVSIKTAYDLGWTTIIWTYGADEWREGATEQTIFDNVYGNEAPGALYYTHTDRQIVVNVLPRLIEAFQGDGYKLVTAGEILAVQE